MMKTERIAQALNHPDVRVVSFDVFDTLLERPTLCPTNIFVLLQEKAREITGRARFDFHRARSRAEQEAVAQACRGKPLAYTLTFREIYASFGARHRLSPPQVDELMALEKQLEHQLLSVKPDGKLLYEAAVAAGKRIICITDMYHEQAFLQDVLATRGYDQVATVYVSSEVGKRKDSGELFSHVLDREQLEAHQLLHVGDNRHSDHDMPLRLGIPAYHLPSSIQRFRKALAPQHRWPSTCPPQEALVLGAAINRWAAQADDSGPCLFPTPEDIGYLGIGPILFAVAQCLRMNQMIQKRYPIIHFASRDGFLPMRAYEQLRERSARPAAPARYVYCGRCLYHVVGYHGDPLRYLVKRLRTEWASGDITVGDLFDSLVAPGLLALDDSRRTIRAADDARNNYTVVRSVLDDLGPAVDAHLRQKLENLKAYYGQNLTFSADGRALVFDCGYNGSVSTSLMRVVPGKVDKAYLYKTLINTLHDLRAGTRTYTLGGNLAQVNPMGLVNLLEEIFAAPEDQCIDIAREADDFQPVFNREQTLSTATRECLEAIQQAALQFVTDMQQMFGDYIDGIRLDSMDFAMAPLMAALDSPTDLSLRHFENIRFPDTFFADDRSLAEKIEPRDREHLLRSPFVGTTATVSRSRGGIPDSEMRVAIHLHLYHPEGAEPFIARLAAFPVPYDLFISVCDDLHVALARGLFAQALGPRLNRLEVRRVPNRGRDVGPWVVEIGPLLQDYDLVAHLHTKKSTHFSWGEHWRDYLLDNLIGPDAFTDIHQLFHANPDLGVLFPPIYQKLFEFWGRGNHPLLEEGDRRNCLALMQRMGVSGTLAKHALLFPAGTMLWYRPPALAPLMEAGLAFEDFPEEPIGITGTLAHAIERLPAVVAQHQGYSARCYIRQQELLDLHAHMRLASISKGYRQVRLQAYAQRVWVRFAWCALKVLPPGTGRYRLARAMGSRAAALVARLRNTGQ